MSSKGVSVIREFDIFEENPHCNNCGKQFVYFDEDGCFIRDYCTECGASSEY